jgi:ABC-type multidrug transport system fused ATPase/permease subunit
VSALQAVGDGMVVAKRNLIKIKRVPDLLVFTTLSPIMFVLLFAYVFGGAIAVPGGDYREFLIAGIFAQTVIFGATITGAGLAEDIQKGIIDRFRSLPMSQSAVLVGRTFSDVVNNVLVVVVMSLTGLIVGWRIRTSVLEALGGFLLLLVFAYAFSWVMAWVGMLVPSPEVVNNAAFIAIFPLTFVANTFVPAGGDLARGAGDLRELEPGLGRHPGSARAVRGHPARDTIAADVVAAEPGALRADLGRRHSGDLRAAVGVDLQAGRHPLTRRLVAVGAGAPPPLGHAAPHPAALAARGGR